MSLFFSVRNFFSIQLASKFMKACMVTCLLLFTFITGFTQSLGDYRSTTNGTWSVRTNWQRFNGSTWQTPTISEGYPGASSIVGSVQIRHDVTLNVSPTYSIGGLDIDDQQNLTTSGNPNLTVTGNITLNVAYTWFIITIPLPSTCSFGNGDLTVGGSIFVNPGCTFTFGSGNLNVNQTIGVGAIAFFPGTFQNNGTVNLPKTDPGVISGDGEWTQGTNSILNYASSSIDIGTFNASASGNLVNYHRNNTQEIYSTTYHHLNLSNAGTKTTVGNLSIRGDLTINGTASFQHGSRTVTLNGTSSQELNIPSGITFYNLTINNSGTSPHATVNGGSITVSNVLTMTDGNINLNGSSINLTNTGAGALSYSSGWVYGGSFSRARPGSEINVGTAQSLFPLGTSTDTRPFYVGQNNTAAAAGTMTVGHTNSTSTSDVNINDGGTAIRRRHNSLWTASTTATGGTYTLRAGGTKFGIIGNTSHLRMATSSGVTGTHGAASYSNPSYFVNRTNVSRNSLNANNFHLASSNASASPLPIELLSFSARLNNNEVDIRWSTASEVNNDFFTIERTSNPETFESLIAVDGKGTSKELNKYQIIDSAPLYGRSYYRLKQTDFDGKITYSPVQVIDYSGPIYATLTASPNPLNEPFLTIRVDGLKEATYVPIQILDVYGQTVFERTFEVTTPGRLEVKVPSETFTTAGVYVIKAGKTKQLTQKIVIE